LPAREPTSLAPMTAMNPVRCSGEHPRAIAVGVSGLRC
jgi:hypothetical protein